MALEVRSLAEDPSLAEALEGADEQGFPHFLLQDPVWDECFDDALRLSPELQLFLLDGDDVVAVVNSVGIAWDGHPATLPAGTHAAMRQARSDAAAGRADTLCVVQALTLGAARGGGLAQQMSDAMRQLAHGLGWRWTSPIRCLLKDRYPLIPLAEYVGWRRDDGTTFDPWLRAQERVGGRVVRVCEDSLVIEGSVADWEAWTGLELPGPGAHIIPGGQVPLVVDRDADHGRYAEAHVWVVYEAANG